MTKPYRTFGQARPRRDSERQIKLDLESLVSQITRLRTPYCVLCGENNWSLLQCGHFWHRAMAPTEFDLTNLNSLCARCNQNCEADISPYRDYMLNKLGERGFDDLAEKAHSNQKLGYVELVELREEMKALLAEERRRVA